MMTKLSRSSVAAAVSAYLRTC
uniref:Uncharacterized protein n=1 Tax=Peronospora matthiolae TaxID=2874970 RepID=A0AAV1V451_9STRA